MHFRSRFFSRAVVAFELGGLAFLAPAALAAPPTSAWVKPAADGRLQYKTTDRGDRILDFSFAGYKGGGVALPDVPVKATVQPAGGGDDSAAIQAAIDQVAALPVENGFRGAVLLAPGVFTCSKALNLVVSGIVLRGSGSGPQGTTIRMTGPRHAAVVIGARRGREAGAAAGKAESGATDAGDTTVTSGYVPAGTTTFDVASAQGFAVGDRIALYRPTTAAWVHAMDMDTLNRDGRAQTWIGSNRSEIMYRTITRVAGNRLTVDIPLADSFDAKLLNPPGTRVSHAPVEPRVTQVGVEHLHLQCPALKIAYGQAPYSAVRIGGDDCWVRDLFCEETMNSTVLAGNRITMQEIVITHTYPNLGASKPTDFSLEGSENLIDRCQVTGDNEYFVWTGSLEMGPNVILNSVFRGRGSRVQPHMRWSTGLLVDNCTVPDGGIDFMNRGVAGSGHGWTMGWAVAWNCVANDYIIQAPPGVANWAIGCIGERSLRARMFDEKPVLPEGIYDSHGVPVAPQSLYLAQLAERRGPAAVRAIGYPANTPAAFPNKNVPKLPAIQADVDKSLGPDLAFHRPVNTNNVRRSEDEADFRAEYALDGDPNTYWATNDGVTECRYEVDMEGPVQVNTAVLEEALGAHVQAYKIEAKNGNNWTLLAEGTTIGEHKVDHFPAVIAWKVRLTILKSDRYIALRKFGLYLQPKT
jgi:hypothetical protein